MWGGGGGGGVGVWAGWHSREGNATRCPPPLHAQVDEVERGADGAVLAGILSDLRRHKQSRALLQLNGTIAAQHAPPLRPLKNGLGNSVLRRKSAVEQGGNSTRRGAGGGQRGVPLAAAADSDEENAAGGSAANIVRAPALAPLGPKGPKKKSFSQQAAELAAAAAAKVPRRQQQQQQEGQQQAKRHKGAARAVAAAPPPERPAAATDAPLAPNAVAALGLVAARATLEYNQAMAVTAALAASLCGRSGER